MSGLPARTENAINGVDVREQGNTLRVATNTPHLVSLGTGRLSTAVTLHPIKQGRVTIGSDPTCDIYVVGSGVASVHCRVENSHGVVTLYPCAGSTLVDSVPVDRPARLSQGSMLTIGRSNYLRFNHPAEAMLMKSVLPASRRDPNITAGYVNVTHTDPSQCYQPNKLKDLSQVDQELDHTLRELTKPKPKEDDKKITSIMSKVSKFEYYAKQHKNVGRSQFYTNNESEISPKVFSSNSLTVNTPAKDVLGGKTMPNYMNKLNQKVVVSENNSVDPKSCTYANVAIRNNKIGDIVKNFDEGKLPKKVNNEEKDNVYGRINSDRKDADKTDAKFQEYSRNNLENRSQDSRNVMSEMSRSYQDTSFEISKINHETRKREFRNNLDQDARKPIAFDPEYIRKPFAYDQNPSRNVSKDPEFSIHVSKDPEFPKNVSKDPEFHRNVSKNPEFPTNVSNDPEFSRNHAEASRSEDRDLESSRMLNGVGLPLYAPVYANQYDRSKEAETMRKKAYQERVKEEEKKEAEMERLEEILDIFTEYQKQLSTDFRSDGVPITPTEKRPHNKIITNGSLPRSVAFNNPNFVKTSDGYYKFETSHNRPDLSQSLPTRNLSSYENFDPQLTPEVTLPDKNYENIGRMDEIGIPVFDDLFSPNYESQNPNTEAKNQNFEAKNLNFEAQNHNFEAKNETSPESMTYENVYVNRPVFNSLKPKSPNTSSPRTRIKTSFAHRNITPQYFVFPDRQPNQDISRNVNTDNPNTVHVQESPKNIEKDTTITNQILDTMKTNENMSSSRVKADLVDSRINTDVGSPRKVEKIGIEKQLSLEEDIPMIDDSDLANDIECRYSNINKDDEKTNQSFEDVKKELMADIPELEAFEKDLEQNKREKIIKNLTEEVKKIATKPDIDNKTDINNKTNMNNKTDINNDNSVMDININDLKKKYEELKETRRKLVAEIHEFKCRMTEITSQEDDILRELEMEKALIKGEYDSEIAILKIEQRKKTELCDKARQIEEEIAQLKERQEARQNEMRDRVEVATMKVERLERDHKNNSATLEELHNAQDILDNESKIYEDLEFQHLEEESELLSNREDLQNEIILLTKKIDAQKTRILTLKSEANNNLTSALDETKVLHTEYVKHLNNVEELTAKVQSIEKELKPIVTKLNEIERAQSPDSAFYTDQTRTKSGEYSYSPQSSDSDDIDTKITNFENHTKELKDKFNSIDQMSQSMTVDVEKRIEDSPKSKKGFWERNFDSLKRKKKPKSPEKVDIMSQSLNENLFYNNESIEDSAFERFGSLRNSKKKDKVGPIKSNSSSKIPTFAALGKIIKKDSFGKKNDEKSAKNPKPLDVKYKAKSLSPDKVDVVEESFEVKVIHRKSCGDEPNKGFSRISDSGKIPSQDDIDRISKVTIDAPLLSSETDVNTLGKRTLDSLMEVERKRFEMLEEQGCQMIENEREKISELKRKAQDETKKLWDQKYREKSVDSDFNSLNDDRRNSDQSDKFDRSNDKFDRSSDKLDRSDSEFDENRDKFDRNDAKFDRSNDRFDRSNNFERSINEKIDRAAAFDRSSHERSDFDQERSVKFDRSVNFDSSSDKFERQEKSVDFDRSTIDNFDRPMDRTFDQSLVEDASLIEDGFMVNSTIFEESSGLMSSDIDELQVRNSRTDSTEDEKRSDDSRPLSHASDFSRDNILSLSNAPRRSRRGVAPYSEWQRPLTRYLPQDREDFDLRRHVESAGHQIELCPHVTVTAAACRGYLHKLGAKFHTWSKRWFVFDRETKTFVYYWDKSEKKPRGGAYFQVIEEVYLDHGNTSKSPSPQTTFIVKTRQRRYFLMAPSGEAARIWIDAIFTGAQGYTEYLE